MATLTVHIPAHAGSGSDYLHNIAEAARALFAAIRAVPLSAPAAAEELPVAREVAGDDMSLFRLYSLASPYDSVMPNLAQELRMIAGRDAD